ncbi:ATP-binding protein [[Eubacterium] siraeum]|nr:ATP-binding protein [[Eubacterium] siraeum]
MIKTLAKLFKQEKEKFVVPKGVQDVIPINAIYDDGIFKVGKDKFSKSFKFTDINYAVANREDKEAMFLEYSELLNSFDSGATTKITINNRRLNRLDFEETILLPLKGDELDVYCDEYNKMLLEKATGANAIVQDKYITISVSKKNIEEARSYFARVGADLIAHFGRLGSKCTELETDERLRVFHDFYRVGEESSFHFDIRETRRKGHDFKDYICPDSMEFEKDYLKIGDRYARVLFLREYASFIKDDMVAELTDLNRNLMMSIDVIPVPTDEAVREAESRLLGVETNISNWQRKQNQNNNFSAAVPYDMEQQRKEMKEFLDDLTTRDQRMMFAVITFVHTADSKAQLDQDTEALLTTARKHLCQFGVLKFQQLDGLNSVMPFGIRKIDTFRTLTTESLAVFIPFRVQDIYHENGIYYGQNVISKNMIIADRRLLLNGNAFILGVSGGGKSFAAKGEIINQILASEADVIIIDPEREYSALVKELGGEIINISATSKSHINAMDMNKEYGDGANPVILKSEFIMSLCEQLIGGENLGAKQKSIIDRCTASVYRAYQQSGYTGTVPTLRDFREELLRQDEPEAREIALAIELFTNGSLNTFAKPTNVDTDNRLICYDILDLGKQLMPIGMLVVLDSILNRITQNRAKGKNTYIFIDEIYLLFRHEYSANFLFTLWKRVRKYGAYATGITQNVDDLLQSHTARTMLANSEFIIMLSQASTDRMRLAELLNISDRQMSYITDVEAGHGLIKVGSSLVPFANKFPKNTKLYKLMTTKPGESV